MRKAQLLSTVAVALLFAASAVSAQGVKRDEAPTPAPAAQQNAPAEKIAPAPNADSKKPGADMKAQTAPKMEPNADKAKAAQNPANDNAKSAQTPSSPAGAKSTETKSDVKASDSKASDSKASDSKPDAKPNAAQAPAPKATTGQGSAATSATLTTEQRTKITTVIKQQKVAPVQINVSVRVGTRVPDSVRFYPLPAEVFVIYPSWRGYDYILVGNQILVIDPRTHEIVAILDA